jgi:hypothetical protein
MTTTRITIGGRTWDVPPMNIRVMKKTWPDIVAPPENDMMGSMQKFLRIAAVAIAEVDHDVTAESLEDIASIGELRSLDSALAELYRNSGLVAPEGNEAATTENPSTETGTPSSPSSSPTA